MEKQGESGTELSQAIGTMQKATEEIRKYFLGKTEVVDKILAAIASSGHVLLEDNPGVGKTFLAKLFTRVLGLTYRRIQFTPDLLPSDITGTKVWRQESRTFETIKGPIFSNLILADEINRAPPKTQAALLEAMEEKQVTIEGETYKLPLPFIVIATQNPIEFEGTYPLPEAQMDRFMIRLSIGYPENEIDLLKRRIGWKSDDPSASASQVLDAEALLRIQRLAESSITVSDQIISYIAGFNTIRKDDRVAAGPSPRGLISLLRISRARAIIENRDFVTPDDVKGIVRQTLSHRLVLKPEISLEDIDTEAIVGEYADKLTVPM
ncbi:methanol dehydrogenase regulatory protein [mine drainage metagenome]|uniref:Methanol dehydrogenase regulatory protein n=2 Tax=mine drainage metagenome TaxID=410659 RepID=T1ASV2_9ZZZZ